MPAALHAIGSAMIFSLLLSACTPRVDEQFHITNNTEEVVTVKGKHNIQPLATLAPGGSISIGLPIHMCQDSEPKEGNLLVATGVISGKAYVYGPLLCNGEAWKIES
jgi:hypothetical protein